MAVSLSGIIFVSLAIQFGLQDSFRNYLDLRRSEHIALVVELLENDYAQQGSITGSNTALLMHQQAMYENLFYRIYDRDNKLIIDSTELISMTNMMRYPMHENRTAGGEPPDFQGTKLYSKEYQLMAQGEKIGELKAYFFQGYLETDFKFLGQTNKYILGAALTMIVIASLFSFFFSRRLATGLSQLRDAAQELKRNNLEIRIPENLHQTEEMQELALAFNDLATSLGRQEKLRKQFTGDLAHELRTPLSTLRSQLEAFQDGVWNPTPERLKQSHDELMRLVRLVNDLEKLLAAENPQILLNREQLNAGSMLKSLGEHFTPIFRKKGVSLQVYSPVEDLWFKADKDRFIQIMTNLINNALKYTPRNGIVTLSAKGIKVKDLGAVVAFHVEDTGGGISKDDMPHIFERFYRGDKSRDRKTGGVGIGLSIVNALVQAHQGRVELDSEPGKGTMVKVYLPVS
jgi:signal transduction histidine kinase